MGPGDDCRVMYAGFEVGSPFLCYTTHIHARQAAMLTIWASSAKIVLKSICTQFITIFIILTLDFDSIALSSEFLPLYVVGTLSHSHGTLLRMFVITVAWRLKMDVVSHGEYQNAGY